MKILNSQLKEDLKEGKPLKLDLGGGKNPRDGFYSLDHVDLDTTDILVDLNKPLTHLPDNCAEYIFSRHTLEHIENLLLLMKELYRITKPDGKIEIVVPHFSNVYGYSDPTHVRFFGLYTMNYFVSAENQHNSRKVPDFYVNEKFIIDSVRIEFYKTTFMDRFIGAIFRRVINYDISLQNFYERRLSSFFHAHQIRYILHPDK